MSELSINTHINLNDEKDIYLIYYKNENKVKVNNSIKEIKNSLNNYLMNSLDKKIEVDSFENLMFSLLKSVLNNLYDEPYYFFIDDECIDNKSSDPYYKLSIVDGYLIFTFINVDAVTFIVDVIYSLNKAFEAIISFVIKEKANE